MLFLHPPKATVARPRLDVAGMMLLVMWRHRVNIARGDLMHLVTTDRVKPTSNR